jgi:hypothetical protein
LAPIPVAAGAAVVRVTPALSFIGVHLFAHWLAQQETFEPVVAGLKQAISGVLPTSLRETRFSMAYSHPY